MFKHFLFAITIVTIALAFPSSVLAATSEEKANSILPKETVASEVDQGKSLPTGNLVTQTVPRAIRIFLMFVGSISAMVFVYAGIMLIISQGNEEEITKFKNILIWSAVGLVFITTAYAIVRGVMQLLFQ